MDCVKSTRSLPQCRPLRKPRNGHSYPDSVSFEVLTALRDGNYGAFAEIYVHYRKPVCDFLNALVRSREVAEDITHDVFINVWKNREKLEPGLGILRYLYAIAKRLAMRHFRQKRNDAAHVRYDLLRPASNTAPDELLMVKDAGVQIEMVISRMPRIRRRIFAMYYYCNGMDYKQIAMLLNMNKSTVANHLAHAKNDVRETLHSVGIL